jgi:hypothetical protein
MHFSGSLARRSAGLALLAAALAGGAFAARAGEPIRFSGRTGSASTQEFDRREPLLPAEARGAGKAPPRADLQFDQLLLPSQTMTPTTGLTRRRAEALDQRRNWLLQSPDAILKQATDRDDGKSRDARDDREAPKSSVERYLEGTDAKADAEQKLKQGNSPDAQARERERERERNANRGNESRDGQEKTLAGKAGESRTGLETRAAAGMRASAENSFFGTADARGGGFGRVVSEAREQERQRERNASLDAFKRNFNNPWAQTTAGGGALLGAGNSGAGGLSTMGLPGGDLRRPASIGALNTGGRSAVDLGPRGGGVDNFDPKNPLNYGGPETVLKQNEAPRAAPKPVVLEIPRRKF